MFCSCLVLEAFPTRGFCSHCLGIPMKKLFLPAESLMNRLSYPIKFGLLGLLVFLAFASLMLTLAGQLNHTIERSENELVASALSRPMAKLVELTQQHRGMSSMLLGGNASLASRRSEREADIEGALALLNRTLAEDKRALRQWQDIASAWAEIRRDGLSWTQARNFQAHTALIADLLSFQTQLADAYGLTFDPEA